MQDFHLEPVFVSIKSLNKNEPNTFQINIKWQ